MLVLSAHANQRLAAYLGHAEVTGGKRLAPPALKVADDDGRLPRMALFTLTTTGECLENGFHRRKLMLPGLIYSVNVLRLHGFRLFFI
jgi:hypothetical protein